MPLRHISKLARTLLCPVLLCTCLAAQAVPSSPVPVAGTNMGIAYRLPGSDTVYGQNYDVYMHPASTQKIITALSALLYLGPSYKIRTALAVRREAIASQGTLALSQDGTLRGGISVRFSGDPTLTSEKYKQLLGMLKKAGVKRIEGPVTLDLSRFGGRSRGQGWSWDDLPVCFTAPAAAVIINRNCAFAQLNLHGAGRKADAALSSDSPVRVWSDAVGVQPSDYGGDCELEADLYRENAYHITGCVPIQKDNQPWPLSLSVADADKWGIDWTDKILSQLGIAHGEVLAAHSAPSGYADFSYIDSAPLSDLIRYMLHRSNNLYADAIAKNTAAEYYRQSATYWRSAQAARAILLKYAHVSLGDSYQVDGSGLSPHNLITPRQLLDVLDYALKHDSELHFFDLMPVAGKSGTMHWRPSTANPPLKENVIAKTGTLTNTSNLAGILTTRSGGKAPFVIFTNNISLPARQRDAVKSHRMASPTLGYERYVLEQIYEGRVMGRDF
ncbi:MAG: D-alanyl-D-alanine carboxypeptidase/D-alanyl-D-alanine-endopeptidase [Succinivibrio sp.]